MLRYDSEIRHTALRGKGLIDVRPKRLTKVITMDETMKIVDAHRFEIEVAPSVNRVPETGNYVPYGLAGALVGECTVHCASCATDEQLRDDKGDESAIFGDAEHDYPFTCHSCDRLLNTYQIVYLSQSPDLWYKIHMAESMGIDDLPSVENIAKYVEQEAYEIGKREGPKDVPPDCMPMDLDIGTFTETAHYINNVAPKLRALAGYIDNGHGTHTNVPTDTAYHIFNEGALEKFREGWYDAAKEVVEA